MELSQNCSFTRMLFFVCVWVRQQSLLAIAFPFVRNSPVPYIGIYFIQWLTDAAYAFTVTECSLTFSSFSVFISPLFSERAYNKQQMK